MLHCVTEAAGDGAARARRAMGVLRCQRQRKWHTVPACARAAVVLLLVAAACTGGVGAAERSQDSASALNDLLQQILLIDTVESVSAQLSELGVQSIEDLQWATDAELTAMGVKPIQLRKLRHAVAANNAQPLRLPVEKDAEAELQCLRSGRTDCASADVNADERPPTVSQQRTWDATDESELKTLLLSLSSSVAEKLRGGVSVPPAQLAEESTAGVPTPEQAAEDVGSAKHISVRAPGGGGDLAGTLSTERNLSGLYPSIEAALDAARHGSVVPPLSTRRVSRRREQLAFVVVGEAALLVGANRLRAALHLQQDALLVDDSAAAAHYNNIGVTHILLREMVHASAALDRALVAASVPAPLSSPDFLCILATITTIK